MNLSFLEGIWRQFYCYTNEPWLRWPLWAPESVSRCTHCSQLDPTKNRDTQDYKRAATEPESPMNVWAAGRDGIVRSWWLDKVGYIRNAYDSVHYGSIFKAAPVNGFILKDFCDVKSVAYYLILWFPLALQLLASFFGLYSPQFYYSMFSLTTQKEWSVGNF